MPGCNPYDQIAPNNYFYRNNNVTMFLINQPHLLRFMANDNRFGANLIVMNEQMASKISNTIYGLKLLKVEQSIEPLSQYFINYYSPTLNLKNLSLYEIIK
ncbi:hypothetical protein GCM10023149_43500 [Mucilaginibacter gynuensis]|uniref:Uncharacterized protein n=2 Tax=Mucilaginibacter gynuensis TaxID=1302236 RepID=A0ABP8H862_9SPHI